MRYAEASIGGEGGLGKEPAISNSVFGILVFIVTELMFFVALISAYMVSKGGAVEWPPADQPRLPVGMTALNTLVLVASGVMMYIAGRVFNKEGYSAKAEKLFLLTIGLGIFFVVFQGFEWARLLRFGLTMQSSSYGAFFYLIIGSHAVHAVGALAGLIRLFLKMKKRVLKSGGYAAGQIFWLFVVAMWPILYVLVYLG